MLAVHGCFAGFPMTLSSSTELQPSSLHYSKTEVSSNKHGVQLLVVQGSNLATARALSATIVFLSAGLEVRLSWLGGSTRTQNEPLSEPAKGKTSQDVHQAVYMHVCMNVCMHVCT